MLDEHGVLLPGLRLVLHVPSTHTVNPRLSETQVAFHPCSLAARRGVRELNSPRPTSTNPRATSGEMQLELPRLIVPLLTAAVAGGARATSTTGWGHVSAMARAVFPWFIKPGPKARRTLLQRTLMRWLLYARLVEEVT